MTFAAGRPEMVVLDIDGTLHVAPDADPRAHATISSAVRDAVRAVVISGAHVVLCTGRLSPATLPLLRELDISAGFAVCSNGAVLIDAATGRIVEQVVFNLLDPIAMLRERLPGAIFVAEDPGVGVRATGRAEDADVHYGGSEFVDIDELAATATTRLAVHWPGHSGQELAAVLAGDLSRPRGYCDAIVVPSLYLSSWTCPMNRRESNARLSPTIASDPRCCVLPMTARALGEPGR
jgi:hypothetical protein